MTLCIPKGSLGGKLPRTFQGRIFPPLCSARGPLPPPDYTCALLPGTAAACSRGRRSIIFLVFLVGRASAGQVATFHPCSKVLKTLPFCYIFFRPTIRQVDKAARAVRTATKNAAANGLDGTATFVRADVAAFAEEASARGGGGAWDLVVVDPPSFSTKSRSARSTARAVRA